MIKPFGNDISKTNLQAMNLKTPNHSSGFTQPVEAEVDTFTPTSATFIVQLTEEEELQVEEKKLEAADKVLKAIRQAGDAMEKRTNQIQSAPLPEVKPAKKPVKKKPTELDLAKEIGNSQLDVLRRLADIINIIDGNREGNIRDASQALKNAAQGSIDTTEAFKKKGEKP